MRMMKKGGKQKTWQRDEKRTRRKYEWWNKGLKENEKKEMIEREKGAKRS